MKSIKRRRLLKVAAVASATVIANANAKTIVRYTKPNGEPDHGMVFDFSGLEEAEWVPSVLPEKKKYKDLVGDVFWVRYDDDGPMVDLTLEKVINIAEHAFVLRFHTLDPRKLDSVTHLVEHHRLGRLPMLLVPNPITETDHLEGFMIGGEKKVASEFYYEVTINHTPIPDELNARVPVRE